MRVPAETARWGGWGLVALAVAIPVSTAASNILLVLIVLSGLLSGLYARHWRALVQEPVSKAALALFAWLAVTLVYTQVAPGAALHSLGKYLDLLLIPLFLPFFADPGIRRVGLRAFVAANLVVLFVSSGEALWQLLVHGAILSEPNVFRKRITQGLLLAFTAYCLYHYAFETQGRRRFLAAGAVLLTVVDLFFFTSGRTGPVVFLLLAGLGLWQRFRLRGLVLAVLGGAAVLVLALSGLFQGRLAEGLQALSAPSGDYRSSTAIRLSYYPNSFALIRQRPWLGFGIGAFPQAYAAQVRGTPFPFTDNPHNSFLLFWVEAGIPALILFLHLLYRQWRTGEGLDPFHRALLQGLIVLVLADSVLNSFMKDDTEGHLYAWFSALLAAPLIALSPVEAKGDQGRNPDEARRQDPPGRPRR